MKNIINLKVYTPSKLFLSETINSITIQGREGNFTILPRHVDYITSFGDSIIIYKTLDKKLVYLGVNQGVLVKIGRELELSIFSGEQANSLEELKVKIKDLHDSISSFLNKDKNLNNSLKLMEVLMLEKILKFKTM